MLCCFSRQRTAYGMRIRDWSSDVCSSDLSVDRGALAELVNSPSAASTITLMIDSTAHLDVVDSIRSSKAVSVRVAIDIDAGLRMGGQHVGPKRSPLHETRAIADLARHIVDRPGFSLVGVMTSEGQVAEIGSASCRERVCQYV